MTRAAVHEAVVRLEAPAADLEAVRLLVAAAWKTAAVHEVAAACAFQQLFPGLSRIRN